MEKSLKIENDMLERVKKITGKNSDKDLAELLGLKQGNFSARKQRGTLTPVIAEWAIQTDIDLNWLLRGKKEEKTIQGGFLQKVEEWIRSLSKNDKRTMIWFEYQFERKFPDFKTWKEEGEETELDRSVYPTSKVA